MPVSQYFAAAVARVDSDWIGRELDLGAVEDLDTLAELVRDVGSDEDGDGPALLFLEEDDEYLGIVRVDGDGEARVFLSDRRAARHSDIAALIYEQVEPLPAYDDEEEESNRAEAEPIGDADLLADLGIPATQLLALCAEEGMLPGDVFTALCEKVGCVDVLEELRGA